MISVRMRYKKVIYLFDAQFLQIGQDGYFGLLGIACINHDSGIPDDEQVRVTLQAAVVDIN